VVLSIQSRSTLLLDLFEELAQRADRFVGDVVERSAIHQTQLGAVTDHLDAATWPRRSACQHHSVGERDELLVGLYDELVTDALQTIVDRLEEASQARLDPLHPAEASSRLAEHVGRVVSIVLESLDDEDRTTTGLAIVEDVIDLLAARSPDALDDLRLGSPAKLLSAVERRLPDGSYQSVDRPLTALRDSTLLVNAPGEPRVLHELIAEVPSAHSIDVLVAFVRLSGITPMLTALRRHLDNGGRVRLLTTTYTNSTQLEALEALTNAGADVRISYDQTTTRLHAKAWIFNRARGQSTAYVGSSNLTHSAMVPGLEWNVRLSSSRNPDVIAKMAAVFETYWASGDFEPFEADQFRERTARPDDRPTSAIPPTELSLRPFQERMLERINVARAHGHHRNLLVAATGTGKTVMAAIDYRNLRRTLPRARLLFVAHRKEILDQSLLTFRHALHDASFGELWAGSDRPRDFEHVFASVQSLTASGADSIDPTHFDIVIIDEFHHAAAPTYRALLEHLRPRELLGLTATPERADGFAVQDFFDGRIAAELRVWEAIDQQYLVPFAYYGIHDGLDLREVPFRRGTGYDVAALTNVYTADHVWVGQVIEQTRQRVGDLASIKALGFCVSVAHARFMSDEFNRRGIPAAAVWGETPADERDRALRDLRNGNVAILFTVDLFNEGVDVPTVDTILMLRPTESATLFLQQLGRGLRKADGKALCTVLDFVGTHRKEFRFDLRYRALLGGSRADLEQQIRRDFPFLPAGCHMELDRVARDVVLDSIRSAIPSNFPQRVAELRSIGDVSMGEFLDASGLELTDVYAGSRTWSELRRAAGFLPAAEDTPYSKTFANAIGRLLHVDDDERLQVYSELVAGEDAPNVAALSAREQRCARMLLASMYHQDAPASLGEAIGELWRHREICAELVELVDVLRRDIAHTAVPLDPGGAVPLGVHARYTRREIQAAYGDGAGLIPPRWDSGVKWLSESSVDLLAFTLDKSSGDFSPTTRYRDYAIGRDLIHWESQSATSLASPTGQRYLTHEQRGSEVVLFARLRADDRSFWCLGPATYVSHEGERPIAITWRLQHRLPADLFTQFAAAAVA
jgi:superfamily II DNA or RNA helicase/HKD family nuclease